MLIIISVDVAILFSIRIANASPIRNFDIVYFIYWLLYQQPKSSVCFWKTKARKEKIFKILSHSWLQLLILHIKWLYNFLDKLLNLVILWVIISIFCFQHCRLRFGDPKLREIILSLWMEKEAPTGMFVIVDAFKWKKREGFYL